MSGAPLPTLRIRRVRIGVRPVPPERRHEAFIERHARLVSERSELRNIGAAARRAPGRYGRGPERDLDAGSFRHSACKLRNGDLFGGPDVIDAQVLATSAHEHHAVDEIVYVAEAAGLFAAALNGELARALSG